VTSIETTLPAGRREHEQYGETIALLRNQLAALIGKGPGDGDAIARPMLAYRQARTTPGPCHLPAELVGRRPDIVAQRWRVEAAGARIEGAKKDFYPNINLAAFVGVQSLGFGHFLKPARKCAASRRPSACRCLKAAACAASWATRPRSTMARSSSTTLP
jgi:outer membrane protein TolC